MALIINVIKAIQNIINRLTLTLDLLSQDNYIVNQFERCYLLLPLWYQGPIRCIELLDPISYIKATWLGKDLEIISLQTTHNLWVPINYTVIGYTILLKNCHHTFCLYSIDFGWGTLYWWWPLPVLDRRRRSGLMRVPDPRRIIHPFRSKLYLLCCDQLIIIRKYNLRLLLLTLTLRSREVCSIDVVTVESTL